MESSNLKRMLDEEVLARDEIGELSYEKPDPLLVASKYADERVSLICALFAYGNAGQIVKFLDSLDFSLLDSSEERIERELKGKYYRFQKSADVIALFKALRRMKSECSVEECVKEGYAKRGDMRDGLWNLIEKLRSLYPFESGGYDFLIGRVPSNPVNCAPYKRYMMYFRWMVRDDNLDMGLWRGIDKKVLIMPLDTHTHKVSLKLGLIERKSYDMKTALLLTESLKKFDPDDPLKYDFALYRIGQEKKI